MSISLDIPLLRRRAQEELHKVSRTAGQAAADASDRAASVKLPELHIADAVDSAKRTFEHAIHSLGEGGDVFAAGAHQAAGRAKSLGSDAQHAIEDLRSLRVTRQRPQRDPWPGIALLAGIVGGIVAMFLFDPRDGRRRRALLSDKLGKWGRTAGHEVRGKAVDLRNRGQGMLHEARSALSSTEATEQPLAAAAASADRSIGDLAAGAYSTSEPIAEPPRQPISVSVGESGEPGAPGVFSDWSHEPVGPNSR